MCFGEKDYNELKLKNSFKHFQRKLRKVILKAKQKRVIIYQLTIYGLFKSCLVVFFNFLL